MNQMNAQLWNLLATDTGATIYMTLVSTLFGYLIGLPLGIILTVTDKDGVSPHPVIYRIIDVIRKHGVELHYFKYSSAEKCAEQLALEDMGESNQ